jgi:hypothetical protein
LLGAQSTLDSLTGKSHADFGRKVTWILMVAHVDDRQTLVQLDVRVLYINVSTRLSLIEFIAHSF